MNFVDDIDFITRGQRTVLGPFDDFPNIIDTGIAGGVDFNNVNVAIVLNVTTMLTNAARIRRHLAVSVRSDTVQCAGDNAGGCCLSDTTNTGQDIGLRQSVIFDSVCDCSHQSILSD